MCTQQQQLQVEQLSAAPSTQRHRPLIPAAQHYMSESDGQITNRVRSCAGEQPNTNSKGQDAKQPLVTASFKVRYLRRVPRINPPIW